MESTQFDDTLLPVFGELDMAIFMPSIDLATPSNAHGDAPDDPQDTIVPGTTTWPTHLAAIDWINEQGCQSGSGFGESSNRPANRPAKATTKYQAVEAVEDVGAVEDVSVGDRGDVVSMTQCQLI
ncbi:hypothetical protein N7532_009843 [Penicillium argentinense]|uniref:Uncharacterized protein n=1 Tax=Penicillium argentinense TaxID=1131581 RepID=A0A9W9ENI2_9EURO|nr:uncharacterized protein N7532_009843 [Penicillium argentinense]KAJ5085072.1 hypothetical protein N7532_009843 [Penicillium argentinense]